MSRGSLMPLLRASWSHSSSSYFCLARETESLFWKEDWCAHRTTYSWHSTATHAMLREGEKLREQGKADKQVDKMLLALPSRPEMRSAANSMEKGMRRDLSLLSRIRHIQILFPMRPIARQ